MKLMLLVKLINGLSKTEKRYFNLQNSSRSSSNYMQLYKQLQLRLKQKKEFDFKAIKIMRQQYLSRNIRIDLLADFLYSSILKSLILFHNNISLDVLLKNKLAQVEILYHKGLFDNALNILKEVKKKAFKFELFPVLLDVNYWEQKFYETKEAQYKLDDVISERSNILELLQNFTDYELLFRKIFIIYENQGLSTSKVHHDQLDEIEHNKLLSTDSKIVSFRARMAFNNCNRLLAKMKHNSGLQVFYSQKIIAFYEKHPFLKKQYLKEYSKHLLDLQTAHREDNNIDEVLILDKKIKEFEISFDISQNRGLKALIFFHTSINMVVALRKLNRPEEVLNLLDTIEKGIQEHESRIKYWYVLYYNIAVASFESSNYEIALKWINKNVNSSENNMRNDIYHYSRTLFLMIHFEMNNLDLLDYELRSYYRFLSKKNISIKLEKHLLKFLQSRINLEHSKILMKNLLIEFKNDVEKIREEPFGGYSHYFIDITAWLNLKIEELK